MDQLALDCSALCYIAFSGDFINKYAFTVLKT